MGTESRWPSGGSSTISAKTLNAITIGLSVSEISLVRYAYEVTEFQLSARYVNGPGFRGDGKRNETRHTQLAFSHVQ